MCCFPNGKAAVKPSESREASGFSWSRCIWQQAQPLWSQEKWNRWSRTKMKRNFKRPLPGRRKGGQGSGCQRRKDLGLQIYSLLGKAGSLWRWWQFLNQSVRQRWQAKNAFIRFVSQKENWMSPNVFFEVPLSSSPAYYFAWGPNNVDLAFFPLIAREFHYQHGEI